MAIDVADTELKAKHRTMWGGPDLFSVKAVAATTDVPLSAIRGGHAGGNRRTAKPPEELMRKSLGAALVLGALVATTGVAEAARGSSTISLDRPNPYAAGDLVTFTSSTDLSDRPWETVRCFQGGEQVLYESHPAYWPNSSDDPGEFLLGPTELWTSGGADCVVELRVIGKNGSLRTVSSLDFVVAG